MGRERLTDYFQLDVVRSLSDREVADLGTLVDDIETLRAKLKAANESVTLLEQQRNEARIEHAKVEQQRDAARDNIADLHAYAGTLEKKLVNAMYERDEARRWAAMLRHSLKHYRREAFEHIFGDRFDEARYEIVRAILKEFREVG